MQIQEVLEAHRHELMQMPNVVGVGIGFRKTGGQRTDQIAIVVMVSRKLPFESLPPEARLPKTVGGVPIDVLEVGGVEAH